MVSVVPSALIRPNQDPLHAPQTSAISGLERACAICSVVPDARVTFFGLSSGMDTLIGGVMTIIDLADDNLEVHGVGARLLFISTPWIFARLVGGPIQIAAPCQDS